MLNQTRNLFFIIALMTITTSSAQALDHQSSFFSTLKSLCENRFIGEMTFPTEGQDSFKGKQLVAYFQSCDKNEIRIPFTVGEDASRTWIIRLKPSGSELSSSKLELKHDHRHKDGTPDDVTNYGGTTINIGSSLKQAFPADEYTQNLIPAASTNIWSLELSEDLSTLTYHLERHQKPRFTAVLTRQPAS